MEMENMGEIIDSFGSIELQNQSYNKKNIEEHMEELPICCNLLFCKNKIMENQKILIKKTRSEFWNQIKNAIEESLTSVTLILPNNMLCDTRNILILELLERFGPITIIGEEIYGIQGIEALVIHKDDIPPKPKKILIEFIKL